MSHEQELSGYLVALVALGVAGQWLASRTRLPSVLWMLGLALLLGPATGWLQAEEIFGDLLTPIVSLAVAIILFEGSLELRWPDLRHIGLPLLMLLTVGTVITAVLCTLLARILLDAPWPAAALLGAILVVTGPTVIGPILTSVRPSTRTSQLLRWEGITIDPLGAVLALLVFVTVEPMTSGQVLTAFRVGGTQIALTILVGATLGYAGGKLLASSISRFWIPDYLYGVSSLGLLLVVFDVSNRIQDESGLLAATVMGLITTNSPGVSLDRVIRFHQNLSTLLIPTLFLLLGSRLHGPDLLATGWGGLIFAASLIFIVRPLSVLVSLIGSGLSMREKAFVALLAPRGIVAAAVASLFALRLGEDYAMLVPATFLVILTTVGFYGLSAAPIARWLRLSVANPQGCLIMGANVFGRKLAAALAQEEVPVLLVDSNRMNSEAARMEGLRSKYINVLSEAAHPDEELDLSDIGNFLAVTSNNEVNILACQHFSEIMGRKHVFQLSIGGSASKRSAIADKHVAGRFLFAPEASHAFLHEKLARGARVAATKTTTKYTAEKFLADNPDTLILFTISKTGKLQVFSLGGENNIPAEATIIALRQPSPESGSRGDQPSASTESPAKADKANP